MNSVTGVDFQYRNSNFLDGRTFEANLLRLVPIRKMWGTGAGLGRQHQLMTATSIFRQRNGYGDDFNPAMGFVRRRGTRRYMVEADFTTYHDNISWLRKHAMVTRRNSTPISETTL
ncbi:MAG: hypothetical protein Ct9H300mP7_3840 [Verrucomicrobiota bacterium]|nr:MAG: hypothetical protein Ct9H300mP7_3840 [Verrucomicrobiota bacterium]